MNITDEMAMTLMNALGVDDDGTSLEDCRAALAAVAPLIRNAVIDECADRLLDVARQSQEFFIEKKQVRFGEGVAHSSSVILATAHSQMVWALKTPTGTEQNQNGDMQTVQTAANGGGARC
jgi:hypothetical protein